MGRGSAELDAAAADYVAVKVTDLTNVDISNLRFDFDLTFAVLLMHPDGTVYHRYGGRLADRADGYLSLTSLAQLLRDTLPEHRAYDADPHPPTLQPPQAAIELPVLRQKLAAGQKIDCVHCHTVNDAEQQELRRRGAFRREQAYVFPDPARIGLTLDREHQRRIVAVQKGSAADAAGVQPGDDLLAIGDHATRTLADVQWELHAAPFAATPLAASFRRGGEEHAVTLSLPDGWKRCDARDYAWRPFKWTLSPSSGFGGPSLTAAERERAGLAVAPWALRVQYIVDWGERAARGRTVLAAGLKKGDLVLAFAGKRDFVDTPHFQAWVSLEHTAGERVEVVVWRDGKEVTLVYALPE